MAVGIGEGVINRAQTRVFGLPSEARLKGVVVGIGYVLEFGELAKTSRLNCAVTAVQLASVGASQHHGIDVFQRRQPTPGASYIVCFQNHVGNQIALQAQIVLVNVRRTQVRIVQIHRAGAVDRQKTA